MLSPFPDVPEVPSTEDVRRDVVRSGSSVYRGGLRIAQVFRHALSLLGDAHRQHSDVFLERLGRIQFERDAHDAVGVVTMSGIFQQRREARPLFDCTWKQRSLGRQL